MDALWVDKEHMGIEHGNMRKREIDSKFDTDKEGGVREHELERRGGQKGKKSGMECGEAGSHLALL